MPKYSDAPWATPDQVRARWKDAPPASLDEDEGDELLESMILAAHEACLAYAPVLEDDAEIPAGYLEGECLQVRAIGQAQDRTGDVIGFGPEGFAVRVRPLGPEVRQLIRPRRGKPVVR